MARGTIPTGWPRLLTTFAGVALGVTVVASLYFARTIFIPVALAVFLSFLMAPVVNRLQDWYLNRATAVVITVVLATGLLAGIGWVVSYQMRSLIRDLSENKEYTEHIRKKVESVQAWMQGGVVEDIKNFTRRVTGKEGGPADRPEDEAAGPDRQNPPAPPAPPAAAAAPPEAGSGLGTLPETLASMGEPLAQAALVLVLVVFMLMRREDLRNRLIRLVGHGRITVTTMAIDDGANRISRFLFMQLLINVAYGVIFGLGLYLLRVDYAFLWGFLAAVMRYVPYLGIWIAILPPIALSLAGSPGWTQPLWVIGLVAVMEVVTANVAEPILFGQSIGVSEVALLISAAFWAWLWGPVGLVLSAPLTVCLVVLGKYVPQLEFFDILLGDEPALPPRLVYYQRLLARDEDEAAEIVEKEILAAPREQVYDDLLIPALSFAKRDRDHGDLSQPDERFIIEAVREVAEEVAEREPAPADGGAGRAPDERRVRLLGYPARDAADDVALRMFAGLLDPARWEVELLSPDSLSSELLGAVARSRPQVVCITSLPPGGLAHTRYLSKRLRQRSPDLKILIALFGFQGDLEDVRAVQTRAGADAVVTTLGQALAQLAEWLPAFQAAPENSAAPRGKDKELASPVA